MSLPWGVKEDVEPKYADAVEEYISKVEGSDITLEAGTVAKVLKVGLKERKGLYKLIYRYQLF